MQRRVNAALPGVVLVLDLLHVLSYLWNAAYVFHEEGSSEAAAWVRKRLLWILKGRSGQVVKGLRQTVTKRRLGGAKREAPSDRPSDRSERIPRAASRHHQVAGTRGRPAPRRAEGVTLALRDHDLVMLSYNLSICD